MPLFQVTTRELVYVDRVYEIEAEDGSAARLKIGRSQGDAGELVDEQMQDTYSFERVIGVHDENGNDVA